MVDDGSTDATAEVARDHGAEVVSFPQNRGLRAGIAAGYALRAEQPATRCCGRVDADGQHPAAELARLIDEVRADRCDVAVGLAVPVRRRRRRASYRLEGARRFGTAVMRRRDGACCGGRSTTR